MKKIGTFALAALACLALCLPAARASEPLHVDAKAAVLIDADSGLVLFAQNADERS